MFWKRLARKIVGEGGRVSDPVIRRRVGLVEGWTSVVVNLIVAVAKFVPGVLIGSVSLVADAVHSLGDVLTSAVIIWSFRVSSKPPDKRYPFGRGRVEEVGSLVVAVLLVAAALEFASASVKSLAAPKLVEASSGVLVILVLTLIMKEGLARFSSALSREIGSRALEADAWHHRSDALATGVVLLALVGERFGVRGLDGVAGLAVAAFIAWAGIALVRESAAPLIGVRPPREIVDTIRQVAMGVAGVQGVHDIMVHSYGALLVVSLHVEVPLDIGLGPAHDVAEEVEREVASRLGAVVVAHVDPIDTSHPLYPKVEEALSEVGQIVEGVEGFHDLRMVCGERSCNAVVEVVLVDVDREEAVSEIKRLVLERVPELDDIVIEVEPVIVF